VRALTLTLINAESFARLICSGVHFVPQFNIDKEKHDRQREKNCKRYCGWQRTNEHIAKVNEAELAAYNWKRKTIDLRFKNRQSAHSQIIIGVGPLCECKRRPRSDRPRI
jgi:hypothetical protein